MKRKIKNNILFLLHIPPPVHGSSMVGKFIQDSSLINEKFSCRYVNLLASRNVNETGRVNLRKVFGFILIWVRLLKELLFSKTDLCYFSLTTTGVAFFRDVLLVILIKTCRVNLIYHLHNKGVKNFQTKPIYYLCYKYVFRNVDVILLSQYLYSDVAAFVRPDRASICPNGVPDEYRSDFSLQKDQPVKILFLSNLIDSKGVTVLLDACTILRNRDIRFFCDFIGGEGDISESEFVEKIQERKLESCVSYLGKRYGRDKHDAFAQADIFAFPTFYPNECFPLVLLEAMQFGLPIISTNEGGIRDMVDNNHTGFLIDSNNPGRLADKLELLINDPKLRQDMGDAGKEKYSKEFTIKKFEMRIVEILKNSLSNVLLRNIDRNE
ncbi:glycosyltransferase family 4 protein [Sunxiuqinia sp. A32]|uniref:glycosyltransferase family 4 protein n=1 Tax=Sunxiuqinia sp. A32 TaxID=3461496 RepID=UPI004045C2E6